MLLPAHIHHRPDLLRAADVSGVDADLGGAALGRGNGQAVVKMDIRHQGKGRFRRDLRKAFGGLLIRHRQPDDLAARVL